LELLIAIHHPQTRIRPVKELITEIAGEYDRAMGLASDRKSYDCGHSVMILLRWADVNLGWPAWYQGNDGTLATVGMPLLYAPPNDSSEMLRPAKLAQLIRAGGDGASGQLGYCGGYFAAAHAGHEDGQLRLVTNYLAEVPLYRAQGAGGLTVWSNKVAAAALLAGIEAKLDVRAAREYVLLSHPLENRTLWEGVTTEPPGVCILIDSAGVRRKPYIDSPNWYFQHRVPLEDAPGKVVTSMQPLIDTLRKATVTSKLHLSGGMDSRAVAAVCARYDYRPAAVTHNTPNIEVPAARRLAKALRMKYQTIDAEATAAPEFFALVAPSLWQSDGMMSLKYLCGHYDLAMVRDQRYIPIEGLGGEYGRAYYFGDEQAMTKLGKGIFDKVYAKAFGKRAALWPSPGAVGPVRDTITQLLDAARSDGLDPYQASTWYYVNQKMRRWATARRNAGWQWMIDPLQMPNWTLVGMAAWPHDQTGDKLIRAVIARAHPDAAKLPTVDELAYAARRRRVASNRIVRGALKVADRVRRAMPLHVQEQTLELVRGELIQQIRQAGDLMQGLVSADDAEGWLDHSPWTYDHTELFWHTATLAMWCKQFLGNPPAIGTAASEDAR